MLATAALVLSSMAVQESPARDEVPLEPDQVRAAGEVVGLELTDDEIDLMLRGVFENLRSFERMQERSLENDVFPALVFDPTLHLAPSAAADGGALGPIELPILDVERPGDLEELAFADIPTLSSLIRTRKVGCVELTTMYLDRLRKLDETLECVITFTEERALSQARALDEELARGTWRGPLHGIPWGAKDLLAVKGYRTTWGAKPFEDQVIDLDAAVVEKLDAAGAVLIAKLTLGALAWGDEWFGGKTRNPWKPEQGSSGSSAGPASATAAGGVVFAIGSETWGSIVSPSERCGSSSLRPTFGRVSRHGAMALSWSLDKLGPICRSVQDAAIVFRAIQGVDPRDPSTWNPRNRPSAEPDLEGIRVGQLKGSFEGSRRHAHVLEELEALGFELVPVELPEYPVADMMILLNAEAACAFDELTRSGRDDELVRQVPMAWPNVFRQSQLVPAVEYIRANRLRTLLMRDMEEALAEVDVYVHPNGRGGGSSLTSTNLTGHPTVVVPCGFREKDGTPFGVSFTGRLFEDEEVLAVARAWQESTDHHRRHPDVGPRPSAEDAGDAGAKDD